MERQRRVGGVSDIILRSKVIQLHCHKDTRIILKNFFDNFPSQKSPLHFLATFIGSSVSDIIESLL